MTEQSHRAACRRSHSPQEKADGTIILDLGARIGAVAELFLQSHNVEARVAITAGQPSWDKEAAQRAVGAATRGRRAVRKSEEGVEMRRRREPVRQPDWSGAVLTCPPWEPQLPP